MEEQKSDEYIEFFNESEQKEYVKNAVYRYLDLCMNDIEQLNKSIMQIGEKIENEPIPTERKHAIFSAFLLTLHTGLIGQILTTDSAISVSKLVYEQFEKTKVLEEREAEKKIDQYKENPKRRCPYKM